MHLHTECVVKGVSHPDGSKWYDGCVECRCQNGVAACNQQKQEQSCQQDASSNATGNCSTNISNNMPLECHSTNYHNNNNPKQPSKCQFFDDIRMTFKEYHNGQKWLEQCQECECLVRIYILESLQDFLGNLCIKP